MNISLETVLKGRSIISVSPFDGGRVDSGGKWRINFILENLSKYNLLCTCFRGPVVAGLEKYKPFFGSKNRFFHLFSLVVIFKIIKINQSMSKEKPILYCHTILTGLYACFFRLFYGTPYIFDDHNVEFDRFYSYNRFLAALIYILEGILVKFSLCTVVSSKPDLLRLSKLYHQKNLLLLENEFSRKKTITYNRDETLIKYKIDPLKKILLFFGSFDYFPNQESLFFIQKYIAPQLNSDYIHIIIAGRFSQLYQDHQSNISYIGFVDNLDELINSADLVIAPIFSGGGVKIKILHALSFHKPIITTHEGIRGIKVDSLDHVFIAGENDFIDQVIRFLGNITNEKPVQKGGKNL